MAGMVARRLERFRREWEETCLRCGVCCYQKYYRNGRVHINMHAPCRYLDPKSTLCSVYSDRFAACKDCKKVTLFHALFSGLMPEQCGYVRKYRIWRALVPFPVIFRREVSGPY